MARHNVTHSLKSNSIIITKRFLLTALLTTHTRETKKRNFRPFFLLIKNSKYIKRHSSFPPQGEREREFYVRSA